MNIILFGPPGAGKGTQSKFLEERFALRQLSTGDLVRAEIAKGSDLAQKIQEIVARGDLPSDDIILNLLKGAMVDRSSGYIFDGFPRTVHQAEELLSMMASCKSTIDAVIVIDVPSEILVKRIVNRYTCAKCGAIYNETFNPTKVAGVCDRCGGTEMLRRSDDTIEAVTNRIATYDRMTKPIISFFEGKIPVFHVKGDQPFETVNNEVSLIVEQCQEKLTNNKCMNS